MLQNAGNELPVLRSIELVVARSESVVFHSEPVRSAVGTWGHLLDADDAQWSHPCHFQDGTEETARWIFVMDILNHCFWPDEGERTWSVLYRGEERSGYWGLAASLKRAVEEGIPITDSTFLSDISLDDLKRIFSGQGRIPLLAERLANLHEAGGVLKARWGGDIVNLIEAAGRSAVRTAQLVAESFPSFRDEATYQGRAVYFWKRAQIFASDVHLAFGGEKWGELHDVDSLTAFADYKLPQVLRELGVLSYRQALADKVDGKVYLPPGCGEEVEIRAATVHAVEALKRAFQEAGRATTSVEVDNWLWRLGQMEPFRKRPYHRCRTIFY